MLAIIMNFPKYLFFRIFSILPGVHARPFRPEQNWVDEDWMRLYFNNVGIWVESDRKFIKSVKKVFGKNLERVNLQIDGEHVMKPVIRDNLKLSKLKRYEIEKFFEGKTFYVTVKNFEKYILPNKIEGVNSYSFNGFKIGMYTADSTDVVTRKIYSFFAKKLQRVHGLPVNICPTCTQDQLSYRSFWASGEPCVNQCGYVQDPEQILGDLPEDLKDLHAKVRKVEKQKGVADERQEQAKAA